MTGARSGARPAPQATALVAGASGLVGRALLVELDRSPRYARVHTLVRRAGASAGAKATEHVVDFTRLDAVALPAIDDVFCALGTTIKTAGSRAAFRAVDLEAVLAVARRGLAAGANHFLVVSAMGATSASRVFYSRTKGEMEEAVRGLGYARVTIVRPSLLTGPRSEHRAGERLAIALAAPLGALVPARYRPIADHAVARAMLAAAAATGSGHRVIESDALQRFA